MRLEVEGRQYGLEARCRVYRGATVVYTVSGFYPFAVLRARLWMLLDSLPKP